jgi:hypothetical protein
MYHSEMCIVIADELQKPHTLSDEDCGNNVACGFGV